MKKTTLITAAMMITMSMTACGQKKAADTPSTEISTEDDSVPMEELQPAETADAADQAPQTTEEPQPTETISAEGSAEKDETAGASEKNASANAQSAGGFKDNFAVDIASAASFAKEIKAATAAKDLDALADLAFYPLYVGFSDGSVSAESREDLIALGADKIFTDEMTASIAAADESKLSPSMAGFSLSKDGKPNMIFGVVDGQLFILGLNY